LAFVIIYLQTFYTTRSSDDEDIEAYVIFKRRRSVFVIMTNYDNAYLS